MKKHLCFLALPWVFLFSSCDPAGNADFNIVNEASGTIYLYNESFLLDSVAPGARKMIVCDCGVGGGRIPSNRFDRGRANVGVSQVKKDTAICKKDITLEASWNLVTLDKKQHEYIFTVKDSDF